MHQGRHESETCYVDIPKGIDEEIITLNTIIIRNAILLTPRNTFLDILFLHMFNLIILVIVVNEVNGRHNRIDLLLPDNRIKFLDFVGE